MNNHFISILVFSSIFSLGPMAAGLHLGFRAGLVGTPLKWAWLRALGRGAALTMLTTIGYYLATMLQWKLLDAGNLDELVGTALEVTLVGFLGALILGSLFSFFTTMISYNFGCQRRLREEMAKPLVHPPQPAKNQHRKTDPCSTN